MSYNPPVQKQFQISGPMETMPSYQPSFARSNSDGRRFPYETDVFRNEKAPSVYLGQPEDRKQMFASSFERGSEGSTVTISAEMFERLYNDSQRNGGGSGGDWRKGFGNPTAISIVGFLLSLSPLSCALMGWRGAGGNGAASIGAYFFMGGLLMFIGGLMEWVLGNTFPFVVFASYGGFWFTYGATLLPFFNAFGAFSTTSNPADGLTTVGFNASFGFFMAFMALLSLIFLVCSLRTNVVFVLIFAGFFVGFFLLAATFWFTADGKGEAAGRMLYAAGLVTFGSDCAGWYLLAGLLAGSVKMPISLPMGDLSGFIRAADDVV